MENGVAQLSGTGQSFVGGRQKELRTWARGERRRGERITTERGKVRGKEGRVKLTGRQGDSGSIRATGSAAKNGKTIEVLDRGAAGKPIRAPIRRGETALGFTEKGIGKGTTGQP